MKHLFTLRIHQIIRMMCTVGLGLSVVFLFVSMGILFPALDNILSMDAWISILFCELLVLTIDFIRKDTFFLISVFTHRWHLYAYLAGEYLFLTLPILIFQSIIGHYNNVFFIILVCIIGAVLAPEIQPRITGVAKKTLPFISLRYFEFKFFVEPAAFIWMTIWLVGLASYFHIGFYIFWIFIILMSMPEVFRPYENRDMVHWQPDFLGKKYVSYVGLFLIIISIPTLLVLMFHFEMFWVIVYCIICVLAAIFMNISIKYAGYTPVYPSGYGQNTSAMLTMLMLIPGGVAITLAYSFIKYFKAKSNLQSLYA